MLRQILIVATITMYAAAPAQAAEFRPDGTSHTFRVTLNNQAAHLDIYHPTVKAADLYFQNQHQGDYFFSIGTYNTNEHALPGASKYIEISSNIAIAKGSSMYLYSDYPIVVSQLLENMQWKNIKGIQQTGTGLYKVPIDSFGVFAVARATNAEIIANQAQPANSNNGIIADIVPDFTPALSFVKKNTLLILIGMFLCVIYISTRPPPPKHSPRWHNNLREHL